MPQIGLNISKDEVWGEVAKTSSYSGAKMVGDTGAYDRIMVTDDDAKDWQRFWEEAVAIANDRLKEMLSETSAVSGDYKVKLEVSVAYDTMLNASVEASLKSYFVHSIVGRWYQFTNKGEASDYLSEAGVMMDEALRKLYSRKRPRRPQKVIIVPVNPQ